MTGLIQDPPHCSTSDRPKVSTNAQHRDYGDGLEVLFASRVDQIHLKLYATVDQGAGKHLDDLEALQPTDQELIDAARWSQTHDPSEGYRSVLTSVLAHFGVDDGHLGP
jgi:hypothetical protein